MTKIVSKFLFWLLIAVYASSGFAEESNADSLRFNITGFDVQGNSLLSAAKVDSLLAPYTGTAKDFADVQHALEALEKAYRDIGYGAVQVMLPEQELEQGVVHFKVTEPIIRTVQVEGNKFHDDANIKASLPFLKEGGLGKDCKCER